VRRDGKGRGWLLLPAVPAALLLAGFALFLGQSRARPQMPLQPTDGIAVLTGGPERVEAGLRLLAEGRAAHLIVSGVGRSAELADLARSNNVPAAALPAVALPLAVERLDGDELAEASPPAAAPVTPPTVTLGRFATSTRGNGVEIADWAHEHGIRSLRVVTAGYHMPRSLLELRRNLPEVVLVPHPVQAQGPRPGLLAREYAKLIGAMFGLSSLKTDAPPR
jgi:uncharacterized SAM-binding protein YcdF (DUF218 family)